ncbi:hypothetical protein GXY_09184 [Novacetimonas hansenii ATCC 23769]|uniref:Uncharacterized protein n=1 Tax=Novacetimonas hansenii ATCC 23769 TaxID=714995 RepID=D5QFB7_NOVHA|nr:hypothetical protein GXY_09184 [Novacetimonas hansenii ATCC 23769]
MEVLNHILVWLMTAFNTEDGKGLGLRVTTGGELTNAIA